MKLAKKIKPVLLQEFSELDPLVLTTIVRLVTKEYENLSLEEISEKLGINTNDFSDSEELEQMIVEIYLECARNSCKDPEKIKEITNIVERAKLNAQDKHSTVASVQSLNLALQGKQQIYGNTTSTIFSPKEETKNITNHKNGFS